MDSKNNIKTFLIKLISISLAIIIILNVFYNIFLAERLENIDKILFITSKENRTYIEDKIRNEIRRSLEKDKIINDEDKVLLFKFYKKIKEEFRSIETNQ
tara:strand:- start:3582 stop:3881 length:300 start_codon:yes stop_codon:yes gene_type:complete